MHNIFKVQQYYFVKGNKFHEQIHLVHKTIFLISTSNFMHNSRHKLFPLKNALTNSNSSQ